MTNNVGEEEKIKALELAQLSLKRVVLALPHLSGLAQNVKLRIDNRIPTAGVFASGTMLINSEFLQSLKPAELDFVVAHELLHLALDTHGRGTGSPPQAVNVAHDYIINDILAHELGQTIPAGGLAYDQARYFSLEELLAQGVAWNGKSSWRDPFKPSPITTMGEALADAGLVEPQQNEHNQMTLDVLEASLEREWYPEITPSDLNRRREIIRSEAEKSNNLEQLKKQLEEHGRGQGMGGDLYSDTIEALKTSYRVPWELGLQRWFDAQTPSERSYARPSRRGGDRSDIVLPGRKRESWTMHIVLDTSGSMVEDLQLALGLIGTFCEHNNIEQVHILQCDYDVTVDEWLMVEELQAYTVRGFGGSDMSPALLRLSEDPTVEAAIVITDGYIEYPQEPLPFQVLWTIVDGWAYDDFTPPYGTVLEIPVQQVRADTR